MQTLVVYDSQFGNTGKIAQAIAENLSGAKLLPVAEVKPADLTGISRLVVGSPTQGGRPTAAVQSFLDRLPKSGLAGVEVAAFDTRFSENRVNFALRLLMRTIGYAAPKIGSVLESRGGRLIVPPAGFLVTGKSGPLADGELARAARWLS